MPSVVAASIGHRYTTKRLDAVPSINAAQQCPTLAAYAGPSRPDECRAGFTLIEALVVIAIIAMLVTLLFPVIQAAREGARKLQCGNNLKQIGLAALNHESAHSFLPSSGWGYRWTGDPDRGVGTSQPGGWIYHIYAFLDESAARSLGTGQQGSGPGGNKFISLGRVRATVTRSLHCPSRREAKGYPAREQSINAAMPDLESRTDYAMNGGSREAYLGSFGNLHCLDDDRDCEFPETTDFDGITTIRSQVTMVKITDGTSKTVLAGEKYLNPQFYDSGGACGDNSSNAQGNDLDINRWFPKVGPDGVVLWGSRRPHPDTRGYENCSYRFGSAHQSGLRAVFCDGSVREISYDVDDWAYAAYGSRNGNEVAAIPATQWTSSP